jgi:hypothetical protein
VTVAFLQLKRLGFWPKAANSFLGQKMIKNPVTQKLAIN